MRSCSARLATLHIGVVILIIIFPIESMLVVYMLVWLGDKILNEKCNSSTNTHNPSFSFNGQ